MSHDFGHKPMSSIESKHIVSLRVVIEIPVGWQWWMVGAISRWWTVEGETSS